MSGWLDVLTLASAGRGGSSRQMAGAGMLLSKGFTKSSFVASTKQVWEAALSLAVHSQDRKALVAVFRGSNARAASRTAITLEMGYQTASKGTGLIHILARHSDEFLNLPQSSLGKGDLFPTGTTMEQIVEAIGEVYGKGTLITRKAAGDQATVYERIIQVNGQMDRYQLRVNSSTNTITTFYRMGGTTSTTTP